MPAVDTTTIVVLASGRGTNFQAVHKAILSKKISNANIVALITDRPNTLASIYARNNSIKVFDIDYKNYLNRSDFNKVLLNALLEINPDLILTLGFLRILDLEIIKSFPKKIINIHPSLLPSFKGMNAQKQALDYGVKFTGVTVHYVDEGVDTGPIIDQIVVPILENENIESLTNRILEKEHELLVKVVKNILL